MRKKHYCSRMNKTVEIHGGEEHPFGCTICGESSPYGDAELCPHSHCQYHFAMQTYAATRGLLSLKPTDLAVPVLPEPSRTLAGKRICVRCGLEIEAGSIQCPKCGASKFAVISDSAKEELTSDRAIRETGRRMQPVEEGLKQESRRAWWKFWKKVRE